MECACKQNYNFINFVIKSLLQRNQFQLSKAQHQVTRDRHPQIFITTIWIKQAVGKPSEVWTLGFPRKGSQKVHYKFLVSHFFYEYQATALHHKIL